MRPALAGVFEPSPSSLIWTFWWARPKAACSTACPWMATLPYESLELDSSVGIEESFAALPPRLFQIDREHPVINTSADT